MLRALNTTALIVAAFLLLSCSEDSTGPEPKPNPGQAVSNTIQPTGGSISASTATGAEVTLEFPAGAVRSPTEITLRPAEASGAAFFSMLLEPGGTVFLDAVALTVTVPDDVAFDDQQLFFGDPVDPTLLATLPEAGPRTLVASIRSFGIPFSDFGVEGKRAGTPANNLGGRPQSCQQVLAQAQASFDRLLNQERYDAAINSALASAALLQKAACFNESQQWIDTAATIVCDRLQAAIDYADAQPIAAADDFDKHVQPILAWVAVAAHLSPDCPAHATYVGAIQAEITDFLAWYSAQLRGLTAPDLQTFSELKQGLLRVSDLVNQALSMGLDDAAMKIEAEAFHPTLDRMRETAYGLGHNDGWHYALTKLTTWGFYAGRDIIGVADPRRCDSSFSPPRCYSAPPDQIGILSGGSFEDEDIYDDIQFCATDIEFETRVASDEEHASDTAGGDGAPGQRKNEILIDCPTRGMIKIGGEISAMTCFTTDDHADDELVLKLAGTEIRTIARPSSGDEYLQGTPIEIDIIQAAKDAGITPKQGTTHDLEIVRHRPNCSDLLWGETEFTLLTATLDWVNPTAQAAVQMPQTIDPGQTVSVEVRVKIVDQRGNPGYFEGVDVALQAQGGVLSAASGQTDALGYFRTQITADGPLPLGEDGKLAAAPVQVTATATTFEGVTAQASATANGIEIGYARVLSVEYYGRVRAGGFRVFHEKEDLQLTPGPWSFSGIAQADSTYDDKSYSCNTSISSSIELTESADTLQTVTGSIHATADLTADGAFTALEFPEGVAETEMRVEVEVLDGVVGLDIQANTSANGRYVITIDISGGGYGTLYYYDTLPTNYQQYWGLGPGTHTMIFSVYDRVACSSCTESVDTDLNFTVEVGGPPLGGS